MRPQLARLHTIRELAAMAGVPKRTMARRIDRLHRRHGGDWYERDGDKVLVNLARLKRAHPAFFTIQLATTDDLEALEEKVVRVAESCADLRTRQNAMAAAFRDLREGVAKLRQGETDRAKRRPLLNRGVR